MESWEPEAVSSPIEDSFGSLGMGKEVITSELSIQLGVSSSTVLQRYVELTYSLFVECFASAWGTALGRGWWRY